MITKYKKKNDIARRYIDCVTGPYINSIFSGAGFKR